MSSRPFGAYIAIKMVWEIAKTRKNDSIPSRETEKN